MPRTPSSSAGRHLRGLPLVLLLAVVVCCVQFLALPAAAAPSDDGSTLRAPGAWNAAWQSFVTWIDHSLGQVAAAARFGGTGGDKGLGIDPDGTDPDPVDGGEEPSPTPTASPTAASTRAAGRG